MKKKTALLLILLIFTAFALSSCLAIRSADAIPSDGSLDADTVKDILSSEGLPEELTEAITPELISYLTSEIAALESDGNSEESERVSLPPSKYAGVSISLIAAGDNLIHPNIYTDAYNRGYEGKRYNFLPMYEDVSSMISAADIAFINQETIMAGEEYGISGYPCFNSPRELGYDLVSLGFDVINIANNHMLDRSASGLESTIDFWKEQPVLLLGGYSSPEDYTEPRITEIDGIKIYWLSYTLATNGIEKPASSSLVIPYIDDETIKADLKRVRKDADFVIVSVHWGDENTQTPNSEQLRLAQLIADNGADLIIGHHSHTLQPIEWLETERGRVLCIYSLGNFASGMANPVNMVGGLLSLNITGTDDGLNVTDVLFTPTVMWYGTDWYGTHIYRLDSYTDYLASLHGVQINGNTLSPAKAKAFVTGTIDAEFLPEWLNNDN